MFLAASAPSPIGAALIVGSAVSTIGAMWAMVGYLTKRLWGRLDRQDEKADRLDAGQVEILSRLSAHDARLKAVERGHRKHRKIFDRLTWILELQEAGSNSPPSTLPVMQHRPVPDPRNRPGKGKR